MIPASFNAPVLKTLCHQLIKREPEQEKSLARRLESLTQEESDSLEDIARKIIAITGNTTSAAIDDYIWLCKIMLEEEIYFRRNERYRYSTFNEAFENVYSNDKYMARYMNGLLLSQLWWSNHSEIIAFYREKYLKNISVGSRHLEIGPGHGLLLAYACESDHVMEAVAWDISPVSIQHTAAALRSMKVSSMPQLEVMDFFNAKKGQFDSIVFSEVLEHTEVPEAAMAAVVANLAPNGMLFLNMPINSPAPDHLFNLPSPEDVVSFVRCSGLEIIDYCFAPATNSSLHRARKHKLTISCGIIARKIT